MELIFLVFLCFVALVIWCMVIGDMSFLEVLIDMKEFIVNQYYNDPIIQFALWLVGGLVIIGIIFRILIGVSR